MGTRSLVGAAALGYVALGLLLFGSTGEKATAPVAPKPIQVAETKKRDLRDLIDRVAKAEAAERKAQLEALRVSVRQGWTRPEVVEVTLPTQPTYEFEVIDRTPTRPPPPLTLGSRAALRAVLEGRPMILYVGAPRKAATRTRTPGILDIEQAGETDAETGFPLESIGDSLDPALEEYVIDFNRTIMECKRRGITDARETRGIWSAAARLQSNADDLLFSLLDDPVDAYAIDSDADSGMVTLDLGSRDGIEPGMRFVLWTNARPLRRVLAIIEVTAVTAHRSKTKVVRRLADGWVPARSLCASSPFYSRRGFVQVAAIDADAKRIMDIPRTRVMPARWRTVEVCVIGDVAVGARTVSSRFGTGLRTQATVYPEQPVTDEERLAYYLSIGAIPVPARLVPYLAPRR